MKNISISISENSQKPNKNHIIDDGLLQYMLSIVSSEYNYINFVWLCESEYNYTLFFKRVNLYQKRFIRQKGVNIHNTIRIINRLPDKRLKKFCDKNKYTLETEFNDCSQFTEKEFITKTDVLTIVNSQNVDLLETYNLVKKNCNNLRLKQNFIYSQIQNTVDAQKYLTSMKILFDFWLRDRNGIAVKPFCDHIRSYYKIAAEKECMNSSCLGRTLNIDFSGNIYLCAEAQDDKFKLGNIKNFSSISEVFQTDIFTSLVENMIATRKRCMEECSHFDFCQSGCCACVNVCGISQFYCEIIKELNNHIVDAVQEILNNGKCLDEFNPSLSVIVNEIISYNPAMLMTK